MFLSVLLSFLGNVQCRDIFPDPLVPKREFKKVLSFLWKQRGLHSPTLGQEANSSDPQGPLSDLDRSFLRGSVRQGSPSEGPRVWKKGEPGGGTWSLSTFGTLQG